MIELKNKVTNLKKQNNNVIL